MELRHLRYFEAVASTLSFSRAAERLHIAQPPLSRQIRQLEEEIGAELFDRGSRPLRLTPAGQFLHGQVPQMLDRLDQVVAQTARVARGRREWFGIGFVPSTLYGPLPEAIRRFRDAHPEVEVGLSELTTVQQRTALAEGRIDVGFGRLRFDDAGLAGEAIFDEPIVAALPSGHPCTRRRRVALERLAAEPLLLYPAAPRPSYADHVLAVFAGRGLRPRVALEANEMQTAIGLVAAGVGYALVPASVQALQRDGLVYRPLADADVTTPVIMNRRATDASPRLAEFLASMRRLAAERRG